MTKVDTRTTTLVLDNIQVCHVGEVLEAINEAGFRVEINVYRTPEVEAVEPALSKTFLDPLSKLKSVDTSRIAVTNTPRPIALSADEKMDAVRHQGRFQRDAPDYLDRAQ